MMKRLHAIISKYDAIRQYRLEKVLSLVPSDIVVEAVKGKPVPHNGGSLFADDEVIVLRETITANRLKEVKNIMDESPSTHFVISSDQDLKALRDLVDLHSPNAVREFYGGKKADVVVGGFLDMSGLKLNYRNKQRITHHIGESVEEVVPLVRLLTSLYGAHPTDENIEAHLGEMGTRPIWDLTAAIDAGNITRALTVLNSVLKDSSPHAVIGLLNSHFRRMFYLYTLNKAEPLADSSEKETYPVIKAREALRKYGASVPSCYDLVSKASMDMKGLSRVPPHMILEILVSRLCVMRG